MLNIQKNYGKSPCEIGKSTINRPFSTVILNHQRVWELSREFNKKKMTRYQQTWNFIVYGQSEPVGFLVSWVNCWVYGDELTVLTLW
jgi:hypothetical protein